MTRDVLWTASHDQGYVLWTGDVTSHDLVDWRCLASHDQGYVLWTGDVWPLMTRDMFCGLEMSDLS